MKRLKIILKVLAVLFIGILLPVEIFLRLQDSFSAKKYPGQTTGDITIQQQTLNDYVQANINKLWARPISSKASYYEPPFEVYVNRGYDDEDRMRKIAERSKLPPNTQSTQQNFLRLNRDTTSGLFTVNVNSHGFRGKERAIEKPAGTYRVVVLGSYPAFGHAVNDDETYSHYAEDHLNRYFKGRLNFEFWNVGRQGGTSIMGAALLKHEIEKYKPDLIVWDYGWIEMYLMTDIDSDPSFEKKRMVPIEGPGRLIYENCFRLSFLQTCRQFRKKYNKVGSREAIAGWEQAMDYLFKWSQEKKIPVIYLKHQGVTLPDSEFHKYSNPKLNFHYINTLDSLKAPPTQAEVRTFWSEINWLSEQGYTQEKIMKINPQLTFLADAIQYNKLAYKRFGEQIADFIIKKPEAVKLPLKPNR